MSVALCETGQIQEAKQANRRALQFDGRLAEAHFNAHTYWLADSNVGQAIACLESAVFHAPTEDRYRFFLGILLDYSGDRHQSKKFLSFHPPSDAMTSDLESWAYIQSLGTKPKMLGHASSVFHLAINKARKDGLVMEFGVFHGTSIRLIASLVESEVHGFDSFEGIPESWNSESAGSYSTGGVIPEVPKNVQLHAGWFENSIPNFRQAKESQRNSPVRFMNIDCDLYSSTKTVLDLFHEQIGPGTVLVFDEFIGNISWKQDEFKAFHDAVKRYGWNFEVLCFSFVTKQVAILIKV
jgi:tetratricopeptide (TPR) repeat protein